MSILKIYLFSTRDYPFICQMLRQFSLFLLLATIPLLSFAQATTDTPWSVDVQYYYGTLLRHNKNVAHLVNAHPEGMILSFNHKTYGEERWQREYDYPDWGLSFLYNDFKNEVLGRNYGLNIHYNFYFFDRSLQLRIAEGLAYNTNPFNIDENFKNISYGSHILISSYLSLNYTTQDLIEGFGLQAGVSFVHHSNGSFKAPNSGTNSVAATIGLQYHFDDEDKVERVVVSNEEDASEPITFNFMFRGGVNEGDYIDLGQHPFYVLSVFADKRLSYKNTLQMGVEFFASEFLKKEIEYRSKAFPSSNLTGDEDYKRVGLFVGHEFRMGKVALPFQLGYYLYWPYKYEGRVYTRAGAKYYFTDHVFASATVKTHAANAETIEFGIGYRL
jgi:hypothetical protein